MGLEVDGPRLVGAVGSLDRSDGAVRVRGIASATLSDSNGANGNGDLAGLIAEIRSHLPRAPRNVRVGITGPDAAMRRIEVPHPRRSADLKVVIAQEAENRLPMSLDQAHWTWRLLRTVSDADSGRRARVLVAAAKREVVDRACDAVRAADCEVAGVDLSAFAAVRGLPPRSGTWLGAVLGEHVTLFVADGRDCLFTRAPADLSGDAGSQSVPGQQSGGKGASAADLAREIRKTCHYQATRGGTATVSHVTLTGVGADDAALAGAIGDDLDLPVSVEAPLGATRIDASSPCASTIAAGLCVEEGR